MSRVLVPYGLVLHEFGRLNQVGVRQGGLVEHAAVRQAAPWWAGRGGGPGAELAGRLGEHDAGEEAVAAGFARHGDPGELGAWPRLPAVAVRDDQHGTG